MNPINDPDWQAAWHWLQQRRRHAPPDADIWDVWFHWSQEGPRLYAQVLAGSWQLSPLQVFRRRHGRAAVVWAARDALVLKGLTLTLQNCLPVHDNCVHVAGHHGGRDSLRRAAQAIQDGAQYVYRTDIRGYYRHIRRAPLYHQVCRYVRDPVLRDLVHQYLYYSVEEGGVFTAPETGISRGCSLSPLMGAVLLQYVDRYFAETEGIRYVRYMDDFLILSDRRWPVRRARTRLLAFLSADGFAPHPDKTQVGKVSRGFDWLGFWFTDRGMVGVSPRALENHRNRLLRLEEQSRRRGLSEEATARRMQQYEMRWKIWVSASATQRTTPVTHALHETRTTPPLPRGRGQNTSEGKETMNVHKRKPTTLLVWAITLNPQLLTAGMVNFDITGYYATVQLTAPNPHVSISNPTPKWLSYSGTVDSFVNIPASWVGTSNLPIYGYFTNIKSPLALAPGANPSRSNNVVNGLTWGAGTAIIGTAASTVTHIPVTFSVPPGTPDGLYEGYFCLTLVATYNTNDARWSNTCVSNYGTGVTFSYRVMGGAVVPPDTPTSCTITALPPLTLGLLTAHQAIGKAPSAAATITCNGRTTASLSFSGCTLKGDGGCDTNVGQGASGVITAHINGGAAYRPGSTMNLNSGANTFTIKSDFMTAVPTTPGTIRKNVVISLKYE